MPELRDQLDPVVNKPSKELFQVNNHIPTTYASSSVPLSSSTSHDNKGYVDIMTKHDGSIPNPYDANANTQKPKYSEQVLADMTKRYQYRKQYNFHMQLYEPTQAKSNNPSTHAMVPGSFGLKNDVTDIKNYLSSLQDKKSSQQRMSYYQHLRHEISALDLNHMNGIDRRGIGLQGVDTSVTNPIDSRLNINPSSKAVDPNASYQLSYQAWKQSQNPY